MKSFLFLALVLFPFFASSQRIGEIGVTGGGAFYLGDVNQRQLFYQTNPAFGGVFRYDFNPRYSIKATALATKISGSDADFQNEYQVMRNHSFQTNIFEVSAQAEFNFFEYTNKKDHHNISPYFCAGVGGAFIGDESVPKLIFPFGMGVKALLGDRINVGAEWVFRKSFSDDFDKLNQPFFPTESGFTDKQQNYVNSKDWYSVANVFITFTLYKNKGKCHAYGRQMKYK